MKVWIYSVIIIIIRDEIYQCEGTIKKSNPFFSHRNEYKENTTNPEHLVYVVSLNDDVQPTNLTTIEKLTTRIKTLRLDQTWVKYASHKEKL